VTRPYGLANVDPERKGCPREHEIEPEDALMYRVMVRLGRGEPRHHDVLELLGDLALIPLEESTQAARNQIVTISAALTRPKANWKNAQYELPGLTGAHMVLCYLK
jgi:hypothetical protein